MSSTRFERTNEWSDRQEFTYYDEDGDRVTAWKSSDGSLRITSSSVAVKPVDIPRFLDEVARVAKTLCTACNGSGFRD